MENFNLSEISRQRKMKDLNEGLKKFEDFVSMIGLKHVPIRTPTTNKLEKWSKMNSISIEFKKEMIRYLYHEFYTTYIAEEEND